MFLLIVITFISLRCLFSIIFILSLLSLLCEQAESNKALVIRIKEFFMLKLLYILITIKIMKHCTQCNIVFNYIRQLYEKWYFNKIYIYLPFK